MTITAATPATNAVSARAVDALVTEHMVLVGYLVRELGARVPAHVDRDELTSAGLTALVLAARSFDPTRGVPFTAFARTRIRGALLDELRGRDWATRTVRQAARRVDTARTQLTAALGRTPTDVEVAQLLGCAVSELANVQEDVHRAVVLSFHSQEAGSGIEERITDRSAGPEELLLQRERLGYLHDAIAALPDRLRHVITATFLQERSIADVAAELGVTESRVSQLRTEALGMIREGLGAHLGDAPRPTPPAGGVAARRRADYTAKITANSNLRTRLAYTNAHALSAAA